MSTSHTNQMAAAVKNANAAQYTHLISLFDLLESKKWPNNITAPWLDGERQLKDLSKQLKYYIPTNDFKDFIDNRNSEPPESIKRVKK